MPAVRTQETVALEWLKRSGNCKKERIWFSPHCVISQGRLF